MAVIQYESDVSVRGRVLINGGLPYQFLKADGSLDSNTYALASSVHNPVTLGTANGLSLSTQQLSLGLASSGVTGALSGADWNTFNNKQSAITGLTTNYLPKWNGSGFGNSQIFDNGTNIGIGTATPTLSKLQTKGNDGSLIGYFYNNTGTAGQVKGVLIEAGTNTSDFALLVNSSQGSPYYKINGNGHSLFNTTTDNGVDRVQVAGTISASPATTANQVPTWGQVQAMASSGIFTPTTSSLINLNYANPIIGSSYIKIGNIVYVSIRFGIKAVAAGGAYFNITLPFNRTLTSQLSQIGLANLDDGAGYGIVDFPPSTNNVCRVFLTINQLGDRVGVANFRYSISE